MKKGRRTRNAKNVLPDVSASPKRKDMKYNTSNNNGKSTTHCDRPSQQTAEPMKLRKGRMETVDISQYMKPITHTARTDMSESKSISKADNSDADHGSTCGILTTKSFHMHEACFSTVEMSNAQITTPSKAPKCNKQNSNIFLQKPILSFNFNGVPSQASHSLMTKPDSFASNMKLDLFTSNSQPKIDQLWKNVSLTPNVTCLNIHQQSAIDSHEHRVLDLSKPTQVTQIDSTTTKVSDNLLHDEDNSCDSGDSGVILCGADGVSISSTSPIAHPVLLQSKDSLEKPKKPTTPHRILCPSPGKSAITYFQNPAGLSKASSLDSNHNNRRAGLNRIRKRFNVNDTKNTSISGQGITKEKPSSQQQEDAGRNVIFPDEKINLSSSNKLDTSNRQCIVPTTSNQPTYVSQKITEFYPIRRSVRKTKKEVQVERDRDIERAIREEREEGLKVLHFERKGRGIVTTRSFSKGEFVVEYIGDLISVSEAKQREQLYAKDDNTGCYMYYFRYKNLQHCIDATAESGKLGRLVNHSRNGNLVTKTVPLENRPHLVLIAKEDINEGVEITYDYGDRSKESLQHHPWLAM